MDSDSFFIVSLFQQGSYRAALSAFADLSSPSAFITYYAARAHLATSPPNPSAALQLLSALPPTLDTRALSALANYVAGSKESAVEEMDELLAELGESGLEGEESEGRFVRVAMGTVYVLEGEERRQDALDALREGVELGQDQECLAVLSQLYLSLSQPTLSKSLLTSPNTVAFTSDSLLSQLLQARTSLVSGPAQKYQEAYYVFEEARASQGGREGGGAGVGVAQAALGRWDEASAAALEGLEMNPNDPTALANAVALALHTGKSSAAADASLEALKAAEPSHPLVLDLVEKGKAFDEAASKFQVAQAA